MLLLSHSIVSAQETHECTYMAEYVRSNAKILVVNLKVVAETAIDIGYRCRSGYSHKVPKASFAKALPAKLPKTFVLELKAKRVACRKSKSKNCIAEKWFYIPQESEK